MNYKELFKLIWVKLLAEIVILCILFVVYLVGRYLLPKKYRLKAIKFKEFLINGVDNNWENHFLNSDILLLSRKDEEFQKLMI